MKKRAEKIGLEAAMTLAVVNLWTGSPLLAVWVGARFASSTRPSMTAVLVIVVVMFGTSLALISALGRASLAHDRLTGRRQSVRRHVPWLRSMRAERVQEERDRTAVTALDRIVVAVVVVAVVAFEIWFFFYSGSPIEPGPSSDQ